MIAQLLLIVMKLSSHKGLHVQLGRSPTENCERDFSYKGGGATAFGDAQTASVIERRFAWLE